MESISTTVPDATTVCKSEERIYENQRNASSNSLGSWSTEPAPPTIATTPQRSTPSILSPSPCKFSANGIYRRKHAVRAQFRSFSLVLLLLGYALYHSCCNGVGPDPDDDVVQTSETMTATRGGRTPRSTLQEEWKPSPHNLVRRDEEPPRKLEAAEDSTDSMEIVCPDYEEADPSWLALFYALGVLYMFLALAVVCDEFFVPALEEISSKRHLGLSMDVAGATLMAAGGSAPELFTSFVGTFQRSDIGIGTIVGSAVFNVLFVIGVCSMLSKEVLTLTWWPLFRDCTYYAFGLVVLSILVGVVSEHQIQWWEALLLLAMYAGYVVLMAYNRELYRKITGNELVLAGNGESDDGNGEPATETNAEASSNEKTGVDVRWPGTFRAGVLKLLLHPESWVEKGGIGIVAKIQGDVDHVFKQVDINGDGCIDREELGKLFHKLGHDAISMDDLNFVFDTLDLDGNGTVSCCDVAEVNQRLTNATPPTLFTVFACYVDLRRRILQMVRPFRRTHTFQGQARIRRLRRRQFRDHLARRGAIAPQNDRTRRHRRRRRRGAQSHVPIRIHGGNHLRRIRRLVRALHHLHSTAAKDRKANRGGRPGGMRGVASPLWGRSHGMGEILSRFPPRALLDIHRSRRAQAGPGKVVLPGVSAFDRLDCFLLLLHGELGGNTRPHDWNPFRRHGVDVSRGWDVGSRFVVQRHRGEDGRGRHGGVQFDREQHFRYPRRIAASLARVRALAHDARCRYGECGRFQDAVGSDVSIMCSGIFVPHVCITDFH